MAIRTDGAEPVLQGWTQRSSSEPTILQPFEIRGGDLRFSILNSKCRALRGCVSSDEPKLLSGNQHDGFRYRSKKRSLCGGILDYPHVNRRLRSVAHDTD
jgi:hypothetical protein